MEVAYFVELKIALPATTVVHWFAQDVTQTMFYQQTTVVK